MSALHNVLLSFQALLTLDKCQLLTPLFSSFSVPPRFIMQSEPSASANIACCPACLQARDLVLSPADIKSYMRMLLSGLQACHAAWVVHRCA